ncbi:MAG TPA: menaquinone biosynthesis decarboxylase, partial [Gemmatimonadaceae bacterium]|nr:menaquinone biosynthesis decarboxylase [Gemmatimonadaceae bacterium]
MTLDTLREFVDALDAAGDLVRITRPVSLDRELCEIADRVMKQPGGGRAMLFEHPVLMNGQRSEFPVAINLFGSRERMARSLGVRDLDEIGTRIT